MAVGSEALERSARTRWIAVLAWVLVASVTAALVVARYRGAVAEGIGVDLRAYLDAADAVRSGGDPYAADAYVYPPFVAWLLVPLATSASGSAVAMEVWTALSLAAALVAGAAVTATYWDRLRPVTRPALAGAISVTLLYNVPLSLDLWLGQTDLIVLALLALVVLTERRARPASSGVLLAVAAAVKTWPAGLGLWYLRAGAQHRLRSIGAAVVTTAVLLGVVLVVDGPGTVSTWIERTFARSSQDVVSFSVWGAGRHLFSESGAMPPLTVSPGAEVAVGVALAILVAGLVVVVLRWPGDASAAMWNLAGALVLLLPVSHLWYRLFMLPVLWVWCAAALARDRGSPAVLVPVAVLALWWFLTFRLWPGDNAVADSSAGFVVVMASTLIALVVSVLGAALSDQRRVA